jgi:membrane-associated protease RseP (regulator of RpoE activity)
MPFPKLKRLYEVMKISGVRVYVHWSVLLVGAVMLAGAFEDPGPALAVLISYYCVILLHECGHMAVAQRRGCTVWSMELYPLWGITRFSEPYSRFDHCLIAWGGVLAQAIIGIPAVAWIEIFGYTRFGPLNAVLGCFGFFSLTVAIFNLIPARPLDGSIAWGLLPELFKRQSRRPIKREPSWRSWR